MAEFTLNGRLKVKTLKATFKENFGATLRVYKNVSCKGGFADEDATLASIRAEGCKGGDLEVRGNMQVGNFEKKVAELYGIGVQVATPDDSELVDNSVTLTQAGKESPKLCDIVLVSPGDQKLSIVKAVKEHLGLGYGLKESMELVNAYPVTMRKDVPIAEAMVIKAIFEEEGATIKLK